jgi:hypothetical protein
MQSSDRPRVSWLGICAAIALVLLVALVQIRWSPRFSGMGSDSGIFAYIGSRILEGELPYRDVFDTKPPGVFYVNALAQLLGGRTPWSIWTMGAVWIAAATLILFLSLRSLAGDLPAFAAAAAFVLTVHHPSYYQGGNLTETYALLPQAAILASAVAYFRRRRILLLVLAGALAAGAVLFKPTYASLGVAVAAVAAAEAALARRWREAGRRLGAFVLGFVAPIAGVSLYWLSQGALADLWNAVVRFNYVYTSGGFSLAGMYGSFRALFIEEPLSSLTPLALAGAALYAWRAWQAANARRRGPAAEARPSAIAGYEMGAMAVVVVALPLEWAVVTVSGRNFGHYFLTPLPAMCAAAAYLFLEVARGVRERKLAAPWAVVAGALLASLGLAWLVEVAVKDLPRPAEIAAFARPPAGIDPVADRLVRRIVELSRPSDPVFVWADHPELNFLSGRRAPSRYVFSLHLLLPGTGNSARFAELLRDLAHDPPALILSQWQSSIGVPFLGAPRGELCAGCPAEVRQGVAALADYLEGGYVEIERLGEWVIYGRAGG